MSDNPSSSRRASKSKKSSRSGSGWPSHLDFMQGAQGFTTGEITVRTTYGDHWDNSVKNTHNDYSRHIRHEFNNPNSKGPIFNGPVDGPVMNFEGGFVMSNSQGSVYAGSYSLDDKQEAPQQKASYTKRDRHGSETFVYNQPNSNGPIFNGRVHGAVKNHTDTVYLEGYAKVPEGFREVAELFNRPDRSQSDHRYPRGRNPFESGPPPGHRHPGNGQYFSQPMQNEPTESAYEDYQPNGTPASPSGRHRKRQGSRAYPTPSSTMGNNGYDPRSGNIPQQGPAQHSYGYGPQHGAQDGMGGGRDKSRGRSEVDDWVSQTTESLGQFHINPDEDSSEDSEEGPAPKSDRGSKNPFKKSRGKR